jgi:hypothetical protein
MLGLMISLVLFIPFASYTEDSRFTPLAGAPMLRLMTFFGAVHPLHADP